MQQLVGLALEITVVEHIHQGVLIALLDGHFSIGGIQALGAGFHTLCLGSAVHRLTAAHDTAAGAGDAE